MPEQLARLIRANELTTIAYQLIEAAEHQGFILTIEAGEVTLTPKPPNEGEISV